jgi:hypothetical protein
MCVTAIGTEGLIAFRYMEVSHCDFFIAQAPRTLARILAGPFFVISGEDSWKVDKRLSLFYLPEVMNSAPTQHPLFAFLTMSNDRFQSNTTTSPQTFKQNWQDSKRHENPDLLCRYQRQAHPCLRTAEKNSKALFQKNKKRCFSIVQLRWKKEHFPLSLPLSFLFV